MNETSINPVTSVQPADSGASFKAAPVQAEKAAAREPAVAERGKPVVRTEAPVEQTGSPSRISLHFQVDEDTQELTVYVVDRQTKRVLRTIPSGELQKLKAGDLLKLTA